MSRVMISAPASSTGKTTVTLGLIRLLTRRGLDVASAKIGPDYVDPIYHRAAGGTGHNLDAFLMEKNYLRDLLRELEGHDIVLMEGAMGYYDGLGTTSTASAREMSIITDTPTVLVMDGRGKGLSLAAEIEGFSRFQTNKIRGVILNHVRPAMASYYRRIVEEHTDLRFLGVLPTLERGFPSRYLGLFHPREVADFRRGLDEIADALEAYVDIEALLALAEVPETEGAKTGPVGSPMASVALAYDEAFYFYYRDMLEFYERAGINWIPFSPLRERLPRGIVGVYFGGGYPERHLTELESNTGLRRDLADFVEKGGFLIAEGGGFMALLETIQGSPALSLFPGSVEMGEGLNHFGYHRMEAKKSGLLLDRGEAMPVHEFHYARASREGADFRLEKPTSGRAHASGYHSARIYAGFAQLHLSGTEATMCRVLKTLKEGIPWQG